MPQPASVLPPSTGEVASSCFMMGKKRKAEFDDESTNKRTALNVARDENNTQENPPRLTAWSSRDISTLKPPTHPPLPRVLDPTMEMAAFTHMGCIPEKDFSRSYERLEFIGDAYIELFASQFIYSTFTTHSPGKCSQLREMIVKNQTLAGFAKYYEFPKRIRLPKDFDTEINGASIKAYPQTKVLADCFEAYVAAIILSDPSNGWAIASSWLKALWATVIAQDIIAEENRKARESKLPDSNKSMSWKDRLAKKIGMKGVKIVYKENGTRMGPNKMLLYCISCWLEEGLGEKELFLGQGEALGKSSAGQNAAEAACMNDAIISRLAAKKEELVSLAEAQN